LFASSEEVLNSLLLKQNYFKTVGLEMNVEKSTTNSSSCENDAKILGTHEGYKYLGINKNREGRNMPETKDKTAKVRFMSL
jgi:hypothetical protein